MTETGTSRWQRKKDARPGEILDAALTLFVDKGYRATKMEDIAQAAGVTKGTPYLYFHSKEEIFKAVVRATIVARFQEMRQQLELLPGSSSQLLALALDDWWLHIGSTRSAGLCKLMVAEAANFPELAQFYYEEVIRPARQLIGLIVQRGVASGEYRPVNIEHAADTLIAPMLTTMILGHSFAQVSGCCDTLAADPLAFLKSSLQLILQGLHQSAAMEPQS
ncbi:TetR/AcrR family transcriptional regulator [Chromobacterium sphagni]|uniref:TetR family transcriptional regulator n=1 Tax=Chromobacterium sphagni TaxID=1903179 RepID=A0A1S1X039_9NEIS|nr:TetR/AcrR family transcriptional regulator [Chromobacterium sphagni]OHX12775.1 TetR family transcriptional regulator [Chromobacterium sphagni]OHX20850.1 TetR family transcriptional regulator [Chromobacterium sphagni]